jgi:hypothetical protein
VRPHEALGMQTPASVYVASEREYPRQVAEPEYAETMLVRAVHSEGHFRWKKRHDVFLSEVLWGERIGLLPLDESQWQEVAIELIVALPPQALVELLRSLVVDRRFQGQTVCLRRFGKLASTLHQGTRNAELSRFRHDEQVVQYPLPRQIDGREEGVQIHEAGNFRFEACHEHHGLGLAKPCEQEATRGLHIGRLAVELTIGIEERRDVAHIGWGRLHDLRNVC